MRRARWGPTGGATALVRVHCLGCGAVRVSVGGPVCVGACVGVWKTSSAHSPQPTGRSSTNRPDHRSRSTRPSEGRKKEGGKKRERELPTYLAGCCDLPHPTHPTAALAATYLQYLASSPTKVRLPSYLRTHALYTYPYLPHPSTHPSMTILLCPTYQPHPRKNKTTA